MLKLKIINKPKMIKMKCNIKFPDVILANLQEKTVIPTKEQQEIVPDKNYDGLSKVTVNPIPDEYIIPNGELEIIQNGIYDVSSKASANVNVPEKVLGTKTITSNGIYKAIDDNLDGYSEVEVATSGVDINDYYKNTISSGSQYGNAGWANSIKSLPAFMNEGTTCDYMFNNCSTVKTLDLSNFNTSNVTSMINMFSQCSSLTELDLSNFNTLNVTNMSNMFSGCRSLTSLDLSSFNTSNVTSMYGMFSSCTSLINIDLSSFNTSNVTGMNSMFNSCFELTDIDLSKFDTSKATTISWMFYQCIKLTKLDLSNFNTSKVTDMSYMFSNCRTLTNLDISNFDFTNVTSYSNMFQSVPTNCLIIVKDDTAKEWITSKFTNLTNVKTVAELEQ